MKIVTLLFGYVALLNLSRGSAMENSSGAGPSGVVPHENRPNDFPYPHPDLGPWINHNHTHAPEIKNAVTDTYFRILISRVVNRLPVKGFLLRGLLVPDSRVESCDGPHGSVIVDLLGNDRLYACLHPFMYHDQTRHLEHASGDQVFLATVRAGRYRYEADLTASGQRSRLNAQGHLHWGDDEVRMLNLQPQGHVRYMRSDKSNPKDSIDVEGDLYRFPQKERRA